MLEYRPGNTINVSVLKITGASSRKVSDDLATEEPMELRVIAEAGNEYRSHRVSVTMRTPGNDFELVAGFLFSEGIVSSKRDISKMTYCTDREEPQQYNIVNVHLSEDVSFDPGRLSRHVFTSSSCGICGKASIEQIRMVCTQKPVGSFKVPVQTLMKLPKTLQSSQSMFSVTGGMHASAIFSEEGRILGVREDVGRHNALDKLIGSFLLAGRVPLSNSILLVSGRASFELVQKAVMAGVPFICAVGAPSSLAVSLASEYEVTLVGFLRDGRLNVYSGTERVME